MCLENTTNKGGGACYELESIQSIYQLCQERQLKMHIDGARIFNAFVAKGYTPSDIGQHTNSIAVCFSKGLGAPVGSVLIGSKDFIRKARRIRKVFGGGMRQAGYLAAACLYALDHHIEQLSIDHQRAKAIADVLADKHWVKKILYPETNILIFSLDTYLISVPDFIKKMAEQDILVTQFGPSEIRMVFHLDVSEQMLLKLTEVLNTFQPS